MKRNQIGINNSNWRRALHDEIRSWQPSTLSPCERAIIKLEVAIGCVKNNPGNAHFSEILDTAENELLSLMKPTASDESQALQEYFKSNWDTVPEVEF